MKHQQNHEGAPRKKKKVSIYIPSPSSAINLIYLFLLLLNTNSPISVLEKQDEEKKIQESEVDPPPPSFSRLLLSVQRLLPARVSKCGATVETSLPVPEMVVLILLRHASTIWDYTLIIFLSFFLSFLPSLRLDFHIFGFFFHNQ